MNEDHKLKNIEEFKRVPENVKERVKERVSNYLEHRSLGEKCMNVLRIHGCLLDDEIAVVICDNISGSNFYCESCAEGRLPKVSTVILGNRCCESCKEN